MALLWVLILLSLLILVHELGHFLAAKWAGVHVEEFGLGYPPRVRHLFTRWHTAFTLNWLPLGGFVRLYGDDAENLSEQGSERGDERGDDKQRSKLPAKQVTQSGLTAAELARQRFADQPIYKRAVILLGGIVANFIFGAVAFAVMYSIMGIPSPLNGVRLVQIEADSPAQHAGLREGDLVTAAAAQQSEQVEMEQAEIQQAEFPDAEPQSLDQKNQPSGAVTITTSEAFINFINAHRGTTVRLTITRGSEVLTLPAYVRTPTEQPDGSGALGVTIEDSELVFYPWWQRPWRGMARGIMDSVAFGGYILQSLGQMIIQGVRQGQVPAELSGPVGIVDQSVSSGMLDTWQGRWNWLGIVSINLGIMNLLPIPALDGGRTAFLFLEPLLGRQRRQRWEYTANAYGFMALIAVILLVTVKDIITIWRR